MTEYVDFIIQLNGGGGEYRNIFECTNLRSERHEFISKDFRKKPNVCMFLERFTSTDKQVSFRLAKLFWHCSH